MAPAKKSKDQSAVLTTSEECLRLRRLAVDKMVCADKRQLSSAEETLPRTFTSSDGKDILKKSSTRKGRYLLHIAAQIQPMVGGRLGTLSNLDSKNPVLYFDFPSGRLKLTGTLTFPKAKYLLLKFGAKDVLCEDIFDTVVLFADMHWVGLKEENPEETPLEMPEALQAEIERVDVSGELKTPVGSQAEQRPWPARRKRSPTGELASQPASQACGTPRSATKRQKTRMNTDSDSSSNADADAEPPLASQRQHLGRSAKSTAQRKLHEQDSDAELDEASASVDGDSAGTASIDGSDDGAGGGSPQQHGNALPARGEASQASRSRSRQQTARADSESRVPQTTATAAEPEHTISISDNSDAEAPAPAQKRRAAAARSAARSKSIVVSDGDSAPQDEGVQSDMKSEGTEKPAAAKPKRQRAAATLVRKRKAAVSSEDSEGSEEHGEASDPMSEDDVDDSDYAE